MTATSSLGPFHGPSNMAPGQPGTDVLLYPKHFTVCPDGVTFPVIPSPPNLGSSVVLALFLVSPSFPGDQGALIVPPNDHTFPTDLCSPHSYPSRGTSHSCQPSLIHHLPVLGCPRLS